jgi:hypothetical protein
MLAMTPHSIARLGIVALAIAAGQGAACAEEGGRPLVALDGGPPAEATLCAPGQWQCPSVLARALCSEDGGEYGVPEACPAGQRCAGSTGECRDLLCTPGDTSCAGDRSVSRCSDDGQTWLAPEYCNPGTFCIQAQCALGGCLGHVLLLIDRSGSMDQHWGEVRRSVLRLVSENPTARFGVMGFPQWYTCEVPSWPQIGLSTHNLDAKLASFFDDHPPGGPTPLAAALELVKAKAASLFGGEAGTLVVLSDGADTCEDPGTILETLAAVTTSLRQERGVTTWVIGYRYTGDEAQLDAIAAQGGTASGVYLLAGDEQELDEAFRGIVTDWKLCF